MDSILKSTRNAPLLVGLLGIVTTLVMAAIFLQAEREEAQMQFRQLASLQLDAVQDRMDGAVEVLHLLAAHIHDENSARSQRAAFNEFSRAALKARPYLNALGWAPRVTGAERAAYEQAARDDGFSSFQFMDLDQHSPLLPSGAPVILPEAAQPFYFPVFFLEPYLGNERALGLDLLSEPMRRAAIGRATASRQLTASSRIRLVQEKNNQYGIILFEPVFERTATAGEPKLLGLALAILRMSDLVEAAATPERNPRNLVALSLFDRSAPAPQQQLYPATPSATAFAATKNGPRLSIHMKAGDRDWEAVAIAGPGYSGVAAWSTPIAVLLLGLIVTGIGVQYLRMAGEAQRKSAATAEELRHMNRALRARSRVNQALIAADNEQELLENAAKIIAQESGYPLVWFGRPEHDEVHSITVLACSGIDIEYLKHEALSWDDSPSGQGPTGTAIRERTTVLIDDLLTDPWFAPWAESARKYGIRSVLSLPLMIDNELSAVLTVYARDEGRNGQRAFNEDEALLIMELAKDLSFGIEGLRHRHEAEEEHKQRMRLESELQQSQRIEAVGRLAGGIAHDFNNLLMIIMAHTDLLMQNLPAPARERAGHIMRSAMRAAELTGQLLAFSRKQPVQPVSLTFNEVLDGMEDMMPTMLRADIDLRIERCAAPWHAMVDRNQIERVLMNLAVNARDAMPNGGKLTIRTANYTLKEDDPRPWYMAAGHYAMVSVTDTGIGMDEETQRHLFEPFFTTKEPGKGTGLGLSMVYGIVKKAEGYIHVESAPGKGSTFFVCLPVCEALTEETPQTKAGRTAANLRATVLLVEDDEKLRSVVSDFLRLGGHEVLAAGDVSQACHIADEHGGQISLVLTDVVLKGGNGTQVVKHLKESGLHPRIIYMSGYTGDSIAQHGVFDPGQPFLQKPFSREHLIALIQKVLHTPC